MLWKTLGMTLEIRAIGLHGIPGKDKLQIGWVIRAVDDRRRSRNPAPARSVSLGFDPRAFAEQLLSFFAVSFCPRVAQNVH